MKRLLGLILLAIGILSCTQNRGKLADTEPEPQQDTVYPLGFCTDSFRVVSGRISSGDNFIGWLTRLGVSQQDAHALTQVCDTVCTILASFFKEHINSILIVCDSADGREKARMRLFNAWFDRIAPEGLIKVDRTGRTSSYELFVSILLWQDNPAKEQLKALLEDYCNMVT